MNIEKPKRALARASIDYANRWESINWNIVKGVVSKLQSRIAKAVSANRINLVKKLQYLLAKSYYAKLLAVKRVTSNKGKRTSGIDKQLWSTDSLKYENSLKLTNKGYKSKPLRRVYIEKDNGKKRPLGIPTMYDRAMQALYLITLDPVAETILDTRSFGFRLYRSTKDASEYLYKCLGKKSSAEWVLEGDIKGCFDNISHDWIENNVIMDKRILHQFMKAGYVENNRLYKSETGTPQGGIISPTLANLTLNGMSKMLQEKYSSNSVGTIARKYNKLKVNIVTYADDFVVTAKDRETLLEIKEIIVNFLINRGLELSKEKTVITHINKGFDFLGWNFRKFKEKLIIKPSFKSLRKVLKKIRDTIKINLMQKQDILIIKLNQIIVGWCNYHKHACSKKIFQTLDKEIFKSLWTWCKRRHPMKAKGWRKKRYFSEIDSRDWIFKTENVTLKFASDFKIKRHVLIKFEANPYMKEYKEYYLKRNLLNNRLV